VLAPEPKSLKYSVEFTDTGAMTVVELPSEPFVGLLPVEDSMPQSTEKVDEFHKTPPLPPLMIEYVVYAEPGSGVPFE
jgi:hypothetical protein